MQMPWDGPFSTARYMLAEKVMQTSQPRGRIENHPSCGRNVKPATLAAVGICKG